MLDYLYFGRKKSSKELKTFDGSNIRSPSRKSGEQMEHLAFVVHHHSRVCPKAHRSHRLELSRSPERELDISNIYGQFIIDVPI